MFGSSASFATPIGYQTNTYVFGAGGLWVAASILIPIFWPFTAAR